VRKWQISTEDLIGLMGPGATSDDARDLADLLSVRGYPTVLDPNQSVPFGVRPVPNAVWDKCLVALLAVRAL
jgi:hypothetical protein